ncbi:hypothetical protein Mterra_02435 [Calidithermus terrae]|uniref:DinB superfamily protein n=1 Tax=Calidithermus terrae TaxID=1408545 RepID=A0A399EIX3_9DEIN|nr:MULTISPECIES: DUF1572 family protein [Calidithermus]RIH83029.1 hypothetical protein Mterra_02435 [Calidithermus terrae]
MSEELGALYLRSSLETFRAYKELAEGALAQVSPQDWFFTPDLASNSIAVILKHVGGNLRSRWTDFLTSDGEKPDRNRDAEFEVHGDSAEELWLAWENGWTALLITLENLRPEHLTQKVLIRSRQLSVLEAIDRSLAHTAYHVGQIVYLAKHLRGGEFKSLSIPKGKSEAWKKGKR